MIEMGKSILQKRLSLIFGRSISTLSENLHYAYAILLHVKHLRHSAKMRMTLTFKGCFFYINSWTGTATSNNHDRKQKAACSVDSNLNGT